MFFFILYLLNSIIFCSAETTSMHIQPGQITLIEENQIVKLEIYAQDVIDLWSWRADVVWDEKIFNFINTTEGDFLSSIGLSVFQSALNDDRNQLSISSFMVPRKGPDGSGKLATVYLRAINVTTDSYISLSDTIMLAESNEAGLHPPINHQIYGANVISQQSATLVYFDPEINDINKIHNIFKLELRVKNARNLNSWYTSISWDPDILDLLLHEKGDFLSQYGETVYFSTPIDNENGLINEIVESSLHNTNINGSGLLATFTFKIKEETDRTIVSLGEPTYLLDNNNFDTTEKYLKSAKISLQNSETFSAYTGIYPIIPEDEEILLDGSKSIGEILEYKWTFMDQNLKEFSGEKIQYTFNLPGEYNVSLLVSDGEKISSDYVVITVADTTNPVALYQIMGLGENNETTVGNMMTFNGTQSYDPENGTIVEYKWIFSPRLEDWSPNAYTTFAYSEPGEYEIRFSVMDSYGNTDLKTIEVTVKDKDANLIYIAAIIIILIVAVYFIINRGK